MRTLLLSLIVVVFSLDVSATHDAGGYIRAEYIGPSSNGNLMYRLKFTYYRWQAGIAYPQTTDIKVEQPGQFPAYATVSLDSSQLIGQRYAVHHYEGVVELEHNTNYLFSWGNCCRYGGISNLAGNSSTFGIHIFSGLYSGAGNSHPEILAPLALYWADSDEYQTSIRSVSINGDSIAYGFAPVYEYNSGLDSAIALPIEAPYPVPPRPGASTVFQDGMVAQDAHIPLGFQTLVYASAYEITSYDRATNQAIGLIHIDFSIWNNNDVQNFIKPVLKYDPKMTQGNAYSFRYNQMDTLKLSIDSIPRAGEWFLPSWIEAGLPVYQGATSNPLGVYLRVDLDSLNPVTKIPAVLRFYFGQDWVYDFNMELSGVSGVGIGERATLSLKCYPNPTTDEFTVSLPSDSGELHVIDLQGRRIARYSFGANGGELRVEAPTEPGNYVVLLISESGEVYSNLLSVL